jgi:hypothetical protein
MNLMVHGMTYHVTTEAERIRLSSALVTLQTMASEAG